MLESQQHLLYCRHNRSFQSVSLLNEDDNHTFHSKTTFRHSGSHFNLWLFIALLVSTRADPAHLSNHNGNETNLVDSTASTISTRSSNGTAFDGFFNDAEYEGQRWVFDMIDLAPVWSQGIFGKGVRVRVNDAGIDETNSEFWGRYDQSASCPQKDRVNGIGAGDFHRNNDDEEKDNTHFDPQQHGTSVASIIGAAANNGECAVGVAPETTLSWCDGLQADESFLEYRLDTMDVSQNSFEYDACTRSTKYTTRGRRSRSRSRHRAVRQRNLEPVDPRSNHCPFAVAGAAPCAVCDDFSSTYYFDPNTVDYGARPRMSDECVQSIVRHCDRYFKWEERDGSGACSDFLDLIIGGECSYEGLSTSARRSISNGIRSGRNGLGIIYVFASGNAYYEGDNTNLKGYTTSRHTISVGAVGKDGTHTFYSTGGASLFLSAPAGDSDDLRKHIVAKVGGGCTSTSIGTSFASPVVSGVVALVLETNPALGWRDVQGILAQSATPVQQDPFDRTSVVNGAGLWHSNLYGFGIVNAHRAVELAKTWINYGEEQVFAVDSGPLNYAILDKSDTATPTTSLLQIVPNTHEETSFVVESVEVLLDVVHISRGDLKISLTSPSGTESILHPGKLPENVQLDTRDENQFWKLMTVRNRGESPFGEWVLRITDEKAGQLEECVDIPNFVMNYDGVEIDCKYLEKFGICGPADAPSAGAAIRSSENRVNRQYSFLGGVINEEGYRVSDACCICGGGMERDSLGQDVLRHWTIAIYGRLDPSLLETLSPTGQPTGGNFITKSPTAPPSKVVTSHPSVLPTISPSEAPTNTPVTNQPAARPTIVPSMDPTVHFEPSSSTILTMQPSFSPKAGPSTVPSFVLSGAPTNAESNPPSAPLSFPSGMPIANPSFLSVSETPTDPGTYLSTSTPTVGKVTTLSPLPSISPSQSSSKENFISLLLQPVNDAEWLPSTVPSSSIPRFDDVGASSNSSDEHSYTPSPVPNPVHGDESKREDDKYVTKQPETNSSKTVHRSKEPNHSESEENTSGDNQLTSLPAPAAPLSTSHPSSATTGAIVWRKPYSDSNLLTTVLVTAILLLWI